MKKSDGNALWFILIAIALLGLLTVMMSRTSDNSNDTGDYERQVITANEIINFMQSYEHAVQDLLARGCSENEISFWHDSDGNSTEDGSDDYFNANSPTDRPCHVFDANGGGLTWTIPNERWLDVTQNAEAFYEEWLFTSNNCVVEEFDADCSNANSNNNDLLMVLPWVGLDVCGAINIVADVTTATGTPPQDDGNARYDVFDGSYVANAKIEDSDGESALFGAATACFEADQINSTTIGGTYHVYHILHAR